MRPSPAAGRKESPVASLMRAMCRVPTQFSRATAIKNLKTAEVAAQRAITSAACKHRRPPPAQPGFWLLLSGFGIGVRGVKSSKGSHLRLVAALGAALAIALAACAGQAILEKLPRYSGQPIDALIAKLGSPTRQDTVAGKAVYIWAGSQVVDGAGYTCTIRATVDQQNTIINTDFQGNEAGCSRYAAMLR